MGLAHLFAAGAQEARVGAGGIALFVRRQALEGVRIELQHPTVAVAEALRDIEHLRAGLQDVIVDLLHDQRNDRSFQARAEVVRDGADEETEPSADERPDGEEDRAEP